MFFRQPRVLGLILDLSIRPGVTGKRLIEEVRRSLINYIQTFEDEDGFYLYHPEVTDVLYRRGEQVSVLGNYETDGYRIDLTFALKQSLFVLAGEDEDFEKIVLLITDRVEDKQVSINKFNTLNQKDDFKCKLVVIGINCSGPDFIELDSTELLSKKLTELFIEEL